VVQLVGHSVEERHGGLRWQVLAVDEALLGIVDGLVVGGFRLVGILRVVLLAENLEGVHVQRHGAELPGAF
jgi:hypothetical protein